VLSILGLEFTRSRLAAPNIKQLEAQPKEKRGRWAFL